MWKFVWYQYSCRSALLFLPARFSCFDVKTIQHVSAETSRIICLKSVVKKNKEKVESREVVKGFLTVMNECAGLRTWDLRELCGLIDGYSLINKHINCYILQVTISGSWQFSFALHWRCPLMKNCLQSMLGSLLYAMHG